MNKKYNHKKHAKFVMGLKKLKVIQDKFDFMETEIRAIISGLINGIDDNTFRFNLWGHEFVVEYSIYSTIKKGIIETFHLTKSDQVFGQLDKKKVDKVSIKVILDDNGQIYLKINGSAHGEISGDFKFDEYKTGIEDYIIKYENEFL